MKNAPALKSTEEFLAFVDRVKEGKATEKDNEMLLSVGLPPKPGVLGGTLGAGVPHAVNHIRAGGAGNITEGIMSIAKTLGISVTAVLVLFGVLDINVVESMEG